MKKGHIYAIISAIFFGSAGVFVKLSYGLGLDSVSLLTFQYILAVIMMFLLAVFKKSVFVSKKEFFNMAVLGIVGNTFMTVFYYKAYEYLPVAMVAMLLYTYPIIVFIYSCIFDKEMFTKKKFLALVMAFIGCMLTLNIFSGISFNVIGIAFGILSAVFYAFMNIYAEKHLEKSNALSVNLYSTLCSLIVLLIYNGKNLNFNMLINVKSIVCISALAILCEIIPLTLLYSAISDIGAVKVSIIGNLEIPTSMIVGFLFLKEKISFSQMLGAAFVIYAVKLIKDEK